MDYASNKTPTIFAMRQGMVNRGADVAWLSQCIPAATRTWSFHRHSIDQRSRPRRDRPV